jgi:translation initiation factor 2B subunit (eIF-2B alpha/beta/delta family)
MRGRPSFAAALSRLARFELSLRQHVHLSTSAMVIETLQILRWLVESCPTQSQIQDSIRSACDRLQSIVPPGHVVANICHRVSAILLEEAKRSGPSPIFKLRRSQSVGFVDQLLNPTPTTRSPSGTLHLGSLRQALFEAIDELLDEVQTFHEDISKRARKFIHDGDVVLTLGASDSVFHFFARAAIDRHFAVLVLEHAPAYDGITMASRLRTAGIECIVIPDSAVFAVMPRVTTVFASVRAIFADGTIVGPSFMKATFLAARHHNRPVVVLYSRNKMADRFFRLGDSFTTLGSPSEVVRPGKSTNGEPVILNPDGEVVDGSLTTLFINENGAHDPAEIFQIVQSLSSTPED